MTLSTVYRLTRRYAAVLVVVLVGTATLVTVVGGLPDDATISALILAGWGVATVSALIVLTTSLGLRVQAVIWALALVGAAVSFGGTESPSLARSLTVIASVLAFVMAVMVTLLQADAASAEPRS